MQWSIGRDAWIIQDGNYADFERGQVVELAVEVVFESTTPAKSALVGARRVDASTYDVTGRVIAIDDDVWVLDIGLRVYSSSRRPSWGAVGDVVAGRAYVGVDAFAYVERLAERPSIPPLLYTWTIERIERLGRPSTGEGRARAGASREVVATDASADDDGHASYVLHCCLDPSPARRGPLWP